MCTFTELLFNLVILCIMTTKAFSFNYSFGALSSLTLSSVSEFSDLI